MVKEKNYMDNFDRNNRNHNTKHNFEDIKLEFNKIINNNQIQKLEKIKKIEKIIEELEDCIRDILNKESLTIQNSNLKNNDEIYYYNGKANKYLNRIDKAIEMFKIAIKFNDQNSEYYKLLAICYEKNNAFESALDYYEKAIERSKPNTEEFFIIHFKKGKLYKKRKEYEFAIDNFNIALSNNFKNIKKYIFDFYWERGNCYRLKNQYDEAIKDLNYAVNNHVKLSKIHKAYNQLGLAYFDKFCFNDAIKAFTKAIEKNPNDYFYYNNRGLAYSQIENFELSLSDFENSLNIENNNPIIYQSWGDVYTNMKDWVNAEKNYDIAISLDSKNSEYYHSKGMSYIKQKKYKEAIEYLEKSYNLNKNKINSLFHLGECKYKLKQYEEALKYINKVIENENLLIKKDKVSYKIRGKLYLNLFNYSEAIKDFDISINIDNIQKNIYYYRGYCKMKLKDYKESINDFLEALNKGSEIIDLYNCIGICLKKLGNIFKSKEYFNEAIKKDPNNPLFLLERSKLYYKSNNIKYTINDLTNSIKIDESNFIYYLKRGLAYYNNNEYEKSIDDLNLSWQKYPFKKYLWKIYYHIGLSYANLEMFNEAIEPLTNSIENNQNYIVIYHERAKCYCLTEEYELALKDYNRVIEYQPFNPHAYFGRAMTFKNLKKFKEASMDFEWAKELNPEDENLKVNYKKLHEIKFIKLCNFGEEQIE